MTTGKTLMRGIGPEKAHRTLAETTILKGFARYLAPYRLILVCALAFVFVQTGLELTIPYITKTAIDKYIVPVKQLSPTALSAVIPKNTHKDGAPGSEVLGKDEHSADRTQHRVDGIKKYTLLLLFVVIASFAVTFTQVLILEFVAQKVMFDLRQDLFTAILASPITFFDTNPVGRLVTRVTNDIENLHEMLTSVVIFLVKDFTIATGVAIALFIIDPRLAAASFLVFPLILTASVLFAKKARSAYRMLRIKLAEINTRFSETIEGLHILQIFKSTLSNAMLFKRTNKEHFAAGMQQITIFALFMPFIELLYSVSIATVIFYGGIRYINLNATLGDIVLFIYYLRIFFRPIRDLAEKYNIAQNAFASAERIFPYLFEHEARKTAELISGSTAQKKYSPQRIEEIKYENVSFSYTAREPVLEKINLCIRRGEKIAIVGPTGAGKTTLVHLLLGFYTPTGGKILVNGTDIQKTNIKALRQQIAIVSQDPFIFSGTLADNLFFPPDSDMSRFKKIINSSGIDFIKAPDGFRPNNTEANDNSKNVQKENLSEGEKQLIAIARAFARDPDLIIFDEATSYIDSETEAKIQKATTELLKNRTSLVIAHRLSTIRDADRIIVMKSGRIIESGTHDELMEKNGFYYSYIRIVNM